MIGETVLNWKGCSGTCILNVSQLSKVNMQCESEQYLAGELLTLSFNRCTGYR